MAPDLDTITLASVIVVIGSPVHPARRLFFSWQKQLRRSWHSSASLVIVARLAHVVVADHFFLLAVAASSLGADSSVHPHIAGGAAFIA